MRIVNYELQYQNIDGGVWKQGFDIHVEPVVVNDTLVVLHNQQRQQQQQKQLQSFSKTAPLEDMLQIFVVPHSHCDPGWIQTFDSYFREQTSRIITTVVVSLLKDVRRTFIWAEISYFSWWYEIQDETMKQNVRTLLDNGQLEFVTGGWVQPDEANSELYAMEIQLQEGHDWIRTNLGAEYIPQYGWAIDPFGYSPTAAYLWKQYNFSGMVIQRVHYEVKKLLATKKHLEFFWRQTWDTPANNAIHPQKDPYNGQPVHAHDIFTHVMPFYSYDLPHTCGPDPAICCQFDFARFPDVPLKNGMNHETSIACPWAPQPQAISMENVKDRALLLLDQYRKKATLYRSNAVLIPIGDDFRYQSVKEAENQYRNYQLLFDYINANVPNVHVQFSTLSEYFKAARRTFQGPVPILKGSFFTYSDREQDYWSGYFTSRAFDKALDRQLERVLYVAESLNGTREELQKPRRALSLFQHHDGVTGTAKNTVVEDYALRLYQAIDTTYNYILRKYSSTIQSLFLKHSPSTPILIEEIQPCWISTAPRDMIQNLCFRDNSKDKVTGVVVYNPLSQYTQYCGDTPIPANEWAFVTLPCETPGPGPSNDTTRNAKATTKFVFDDVTGLMLEPVKEEWKAWLVHAGGAYLFVPSELVPYGLLEQNLIIEHGGHVVRTKHWTRTVIERKVPITTNDGSSKSTIIDFIYETHLLTDNEEWLVRFSSSSGIQNNGYSYTDLNGFNYDTHRFRKDMPIQSQIFPMPTLASVQDDNHRLTVLSEHAQGTGSIENGSIDVWLDRRLGQDDNRGLFQGVQDNRPIRTRFRVVIESRKDNKELQPSDPLEFNISSLVRHMWDELQHPLVMFGKHVNTSGDEIDPTKNEKSVQIATEIKNFPTAQENIPFVIMSYKRLGYLKTVVESIEKSDFPRDRVPLIISHDGHVPEMIEYVQSLITSKTFPKLIQLIHPYSCHDHRNTFPGDDPKLNLDYSGDAYQHKRSGSTTCCKHHFTWLMTTVFTQIKELKDVDTFVFSEEDYIFGPKIYQAIVNGKHSLEENEKLVDGGFFGLVLDSKIKGSSEAPKDSDIDAWHKSAFVSGPMTMNRKVFTKIQQHAANYCGVDGFDEYNWDWSIVHMQNLLLIPRIVLIPSLQRPLVKHIGVEDGLHSHAKDKVDPGLDLDVFTGTQTALTGNGVFFPLNRTQGFGGWGHPKDHEHCMQLMETNKTKVVPVDTK